MIARLIATLSSWFGSRNLINSNPLFRLELPKSGSNSTRHLANDGVVVIVGANGTGKSRLGSWIELQSSHQENTHRVSAQRSLQFPFRITSSSVERAKRALYYGERAYRADAESKAEGRWGRHPNAPFLEDYSELMTYLFSDHNEATNLFYEQASRGADTRCPPETKIMKVQRIWEELLPHRDLIRSSDAVEVRPKGSDSSYNASGMSDGERVVFYLIGECLAAEIGAVIIIDEPESHVHKAIQSKLWDKIEAERPDCQFVYLTHDLEFAASRKNAKRIWVKSFDGQVWIWDEVPHDTGMPDEVFLQLLGSRKPIYLSKGHKEVLILSFTHRPFLTIR